MRYVPFPLPVPVPSCNNAMADGSSSSLLHSRDDDFQGSVPMKQEPIAILLEGLLAKLAQFIGFCRDEGAGRQLPVGIEEQDTHGPIVAGVLRERHLIPVGD